MNELLIDTEPNDAVSSRGFIRDTLELVTRIESNFIELGARLFKIHHEKLWEPTYDSYEDFLANAHLSAGNASMLTTIYKVYVLEGSMNPESLAQAGYSNLYAAIPLIEKDGIEQAVTKATLLTRSELKQEVRDDTHPNCSHEETYEICATCHKRIYAEEAKQS